MIGGLLNIKHISHPRWDKTEVSLDTTRWVTLSEERLPTLSKAGTAGDASEVLIYGNELERSRMSWFCRNSQGLQYCITGEGRKSRPLHGLQNKVKHCDFCEMNSHCLNTINLSLLLIIRDQDNIQSSLPNKIFADVIWSRKLIQHLRNVLKYWR